MSEVANKTEDNAAADLMARYSKKEKVVALKSDDQEAFVAFAEMVGSENYTDWTTGADTSLFGGMAMVKGDEGGPNRLIALADEDAVFADPVVRKALYKMYVNRVVNAASEKDAQASSFITVAGCFKQKFDLDAFKFQAKAFKKLFQDQGLSGVTISAIRMSFASSAFAKTQFPRVDAESWDKLLGIAEANAAKHGYDNSIFDHWKATRTVQSADISTIQFDFAALQVDEDATEDAETDKPAA